MAFEDLLKTVDVVSFHVALVPATRHLLNADNLKLMKKDAIVVNTSRGAVIDTDAVAAALTAGKLWGAGIDVFESEPVSPDAPIMHAPHTVLTSHAAYSARGVGRGAAHPLHPKRHRRRARPHPRELREPGGAPPRPGEVEMPGSVAPR